MKFFQWIFQKENKSIKENTGPYKVNEVNLEESQLYKVNEDTITGMILGGAIGDALGVPYEFMRRGTFKASDLDGYKKHYQPKGTWSDDTAFTLCQIDNILDNGTPDTLMVRFSNCLTNGDNAPRGELFDVGFSCSKAINSYAGSLDINKCGQGKENDNGNGSLMRIHPLAIALLNEIDVKKKFKRIKDETRIVHSHSRSIIGSYIYIELLISLLQGKDIKASIEEVGLNLKELQSKNVLNSDEIEEIKSYSRIMTLSIMDEKEEKINSTGYIVDTLEAAIWATATSNTYKKAVLKAVNLGMDTDTVGSITGVISGIVFGYKDIPNEWLEQLLDVEIIKEKAIKLHDKFIK